MKFTVSKSSPQKFKTDIISIGCYERQKEEDDIKVRPALIKHADGGLTLDKALGGTLSKQIASEKFTGERGTKRLLFTAGKIPARFVLLVGLGSREKFDLEVLREAGAIIAREARDVKASSAALVLERGPVGDDVAAERARAIAEGVLLGSYRFKKYKSSSKEESPALTMTTFLYQGDGAPVRAAIDRGVTIAEEVLKCRDLVNTPASHLTPTIFAKHAKEMAAHNKLSCTILNKEALTKEKMNGILAISQGSSEPPTFIILKYTPKEKPRAQVALVGKGVTFDSGGLSLKPPKGMEEMKGDMAGAATCLAVMEAIAKLAPPVEVTAYMPCTENMPDGGATRPGDVVTMRSGRTVELLNMDAEGRIVLADALSYAADTKPDVIIDLATLTGGALYVCGELYTIMMGNDQKIIDRLKRAAELTGEPIWQLPIVEAYNKGFRSDVADTNNNGKGKGQTILGALFLREFVGKIPWAHLDMAPSAWANEEIPLSPKGGTGSMVRTITSFVMNFKKSVPD